MNLIHLDAHIFAVGNENHPLLAKIKNEPVLKPWKKNSGNRREIRLFLNLPVYIYYKTKKRGGKKKAEPRP